jgi:hypothetical protein
MVARVRGLRAVVFTMPDVFGPKLLGTTSVDALRRSLASRYPWLELAYAEAWTATFKTARLLDRQTLNPTFSDLVDPQKAGQMLSYFKDALQHREKTVPTGTGWMLIGSSVWERAEWVTPTLVAELLGPRLIRTAAVRDLDSSSEQFARRVLRADGDFVAIVDPNGVFQSAVNRRSLLDRTARTFADGR